MLFVGKNSWLVAAAFGALLVVSLAATAVPASPGGAAGAAVEDVRQVVHAVAGHAAHHKQPAAHQGAATHTSSPSPARAPGPQAPPPTRLAPPDPMATVVATSGKVQDQVQATRNGLPTNPLSTIGGAADAASQRAQDLQRQIVSPVAITDPDAKPASAQATPVETSGLAYPILAGSMLVVGATGATFVGFWLAGSSGTVGVGGTAAKVAGKDMRRLLPFASPLFTRFERDTVLGNPRRESLYALILQQPGISLQALGEASGLSRTAALHHLRLMEQSHVVVSKRMGRSRHYYENGGRYGRDQKDAYAILQNDRSRQVAEFIRHHPGAMQKSVCDALGIQPSIAHWHVRRLQAAELIDSVRQGRTVNYFPARGLLEVQSVPALEAAPANTLVLA